MIPPIHDDYRRELLAYARPPQWRNPTPASSYDLVIVGAGPAGLAAAEIAVEHGAKVALVERHLIGGVSLLTGSVPSKAMLRTGRVASDMMHARRFGAAAPLDLHDNFSSAMLRMRRLRVRMAEYRSAERLKLAGLDVFFGAGRFTSNETIALPDATLRFSHALIATGARPERPAIPGLAQAGYLTSEEAFELRAAPERLLVIGGGPLGCEAAQAFCRLGAHVLIVQNEPKFLPIEERDAAQILSEALARDGVEIYLNTTVVAIHPGPSRQKSVELISDERRFTVAVDQIIAGVGRKPNVERLGLEQAGIALADASGIMVDDFLQTSNPRVYAAGDVCTLFRFAHVADAYGRLAAANALIGGGQRVSALTIPWCTYTDPEIAHVGLYVREARAMEIPARTFTVMMHDTDRAILDGQEKGFIKIHVRDGTDEILGATIVASHAGEMINEITLAIEAGIGLSVLARVIHAYPTQATAIKEAANACAKARLLPEGAPEIGRPAWPPKAG